MSLKYVFFEREAGRKRGKKICYESSSTLIAKPDQDSTHPQTQLNTTNQSLIVTQK